MLSAVLAIVNPSVCLSVCHTLALCQNDSSYDHAVFTGVEDSPMSLVGYFFGTLRDKASSIIWQHARATPCRPVTDLSYDHGVFTGG